MPNARPDTRARRLDAQADTRPQGRRVRDFGPSPAPPQSATSCRRSARWRRRGANQVGRRSTRDEPALLCRAPCGREALRWRKLSILWEHHAVGESIPNLVWDDLGLTTECDAFDITYDHSCNTSRINGNCVGQAEVLLEVSAS